jgi:hypothetical protein
VRILFDYGKEGAPIYKAPIYSLLFTCRACLCTQSGEYHLPREVKDVYL